MLPTDEQMQTIAPAIAGFIQRCSTVNGKVPPSEAALLVDDNKGVWVPYYFCFLFTWFNLTKDDFESDESDEFFEELLTAINEHTHEPYAVFWHEGGLWYGNESHFFDERYTYHDTQPADTTQEPF